MLKLLSSMSVERHGDDVVLFSTDAAMPRPRRSITEDQLEERIRAPMPDSSSLHEVLVQGLVELCKVKPVGNDAVQWLGEWLLNNNPNKPRVEVPE